MERRGFTLAEVLITLGIIGVVATMTIPTLLSKNQKTQYVVALKKAYSQTNQALKQMATDYGCGNDLKCTGVFASGINNQTFGDEFVKYFRVAKNCRLGTGLHCWPSNTAYFYDGSGLQANFDRDTGTDYKFLTADGMSFLVSTSANNCVNFVTYSGTLGYMSQVCGFVMIDVNGLKGPNCMGRDTFQFDISNGKGALIYPYGGMDQNFVGANLWWNGTTKSCIDSNKSGQYCAGRVMEEGWEMNY